MADSERRDGSQKGRGPTSIYNQTEELATRFRMSDSEKDRVDLRLQALQDSTVLEGNVRATWWDYHYQVLNRYGLVGEDASYSVRAVGGILYSSHLRDVDVHVFSNRHRGYRMVDGLDRPLTLSMRIGPNESVDAPFEVVLEGMLSKKAEIEMYRPVSAIASISLDGAYQIQQPTDLELYRSYKFLLGVAEVHRDSDNRAGINRLLLLLFMLRQYPHLNAEEAFASLDMVRASKPSAETRPNHSNAVEGAFQTARGAVDEMATKLDPTSKHKLAFMFLQPAEEMLRDASQALRAETVDPKTLYRFLDYSAKYVYILAPDQNTLEFAQELRRARQGLGRDFSEEEAKVRAPKYFDYLREQLLTIKCR